MSDKQAQAQRYADAVIQAMLEQWQAALDQIANKLNSDRQFNALVTDANKDFSERASALEAALPNGTPQELVNLLKLMAQSGDLSMIREVSTALVRTGTGRSGPVRADITSAVELGDAEKESLRTVLTKQYGTDLVFSFNVDPSLMGGLRVRVGDRFIDTSVASRLAKLRESLTSAVR
jgi:F-type H+-transporting ATPase subunit delta